MKQRGRQSGGTMNTLQEVKIPDSKLAREITELVRETESELLFNHSSRVYLFAASAGKRRGLRFDDELLYAGAMFHDMGLTKKYSSKDLRFEVDGANAAADFLRSHNFSQQDIDLVWTSIALHTTIGVPQFMHPNIALVTAGVEMDVVGIKYDDYTKAEIKSIISLFPRTSNFKEDILQAFYDGFKDKPASTFGTVNADVIVDKEPGFKPLNFCSVIRESKWA
jgi:hypothetical protein